MSQYTPKILFKVQLKLCKATKVNRSGDRTAPPGKVRSGFLLSFMSGFMHHQSRLYTSQSVNITLKREKSLRRTLRERNVNVTQI